MAGKGGGAWKVAYADFVTAMMAFFMVMWLTSQNENVKDAIAEHFRDPREPELLLHRPPRHNEKTKGRYRVRSNNPISSDELDDPKYDRPRLQTLREADRTAVGTVIYFADNSAALNDDAKQRLDLLLPLIVGKPQKLEVRGHSSRRPLPSSGTFEDVWQLSYARCAATLKYLEQNGIPPERIRLSQAGGHEPITTRTDSRAQSKNPRVEIFLVTEWAEDLMGTRSERSKRFESDN